MFQKIFFSRLCKSNELYLSINKLLSLHLILLFFSEIFFENIERNKCIELHNVVVLLDDYDAIKELTPLNLEIFT
jgi:hypothetical protein